MEKYILKDSFVDKYKKIKPPFGFNGLGEIQYYRAYSRLKEDGTNEQWYETIRRVVEGTYSVQKRHIIHNGLGWDEKKAHFSAQEMYDRMFHMKFLPPGRGMWAMGSPLIEKKGLYSALNNCFTGDTKFVTDKGLMSFEDAKEQRINVLTEPGDYNLADVRYFGEQEVYEYTFKPFSARSNLAIKIKATENHRWLLSDDTETTNLSIGHKIMSNPLGWRNEELHMDDEAKDFEYRNGFTHGLIFGDGTKHTYYPERQFIKVCDGNEKEYEKCILNSYGYFGMTRGKDGYPVYTVKNKKDLKALPYNETEKYLRAFIHGWLAADSWIKPGQTICLDTQNEEAAEWLIENAVYGDYTPTGISYDYSDTNFGKRSNRLCRVSLSPKHYLEYKVVDKKYIGIEPVYCVTEPITKTFILESGLITGNCAFVSTEDIKEDYSKSFIFMMDKSMLGVGVGFDVKGGSKLKVEQPKLNGFTYTIPDTREGWVESVRYLLDAYLKKEALPHFEYHMIRKQGEAIKGFGGKSSGHVPLMKLHENISTLLSNRVGKYLSSEDIADIMNLIGVCVVSGNVRRTAQIAIGDSEDKEFMSLKDYKWNGKEYVGNKAHRAAFGWTSNNTVTCEVGQDYSALAEQTGLNGEPGYLWIDNARDYGRMGHSPNYKDHRATGTNPCSEQTLESYEMCCLVETFPTKHVDLDDYKRTLKFAYLYAKTVTLGNTHWVETNRVQLRNRRIGTSVSGVAQFIGKHGISEFKHWLDEGYNTIQYYDDVYSNWFAVPKSIKTTSIKPSGSISLVAGVTPGVHYPISNYYIRRSRISVTSDLIPYLRKAGYYIEPDVTNPENTLVIEVPVKIENCRTLEDVSIWEQCELAAFMQEHWADNQVSCTVSFRAEEREQISSVLQYFQYRLKSISFLPQDNSVYAQMPYEAISKEKYESLIKNIKGLTIKELSEKAEPDKFCDGDTCMV